MSGSCGNICLSLLNFNFSLLSIAANQLLKALNKPNDIIKLINDCVDKKGKLDDKKAMIKLIDAYEISQYSAKKLLGYKLQKIVYCTKRNTRIDGEDGIALDICIPFEE